MVDHEGADAHLADAGRFTWPVSSMDIVRGSGRFG
jgi:hypothetical protein